MNNFYEVKARYMKTQDNGSLKMTTEAYLIDALSFTEAETRATEELTPYIGGEFEIATVTKKRYADTFLEGAGPHFEVSLSFITLDEKSGTEKMTALKILVREEDIERAHSRVINEMNKSNIDYRITAIKETAILDILYIESERITPEAEVEVTEIC